MLLMKEAPKLFLRVSHNLVVISVGQVGRIMVSDLHKSAREFFLLWRDSGKPKHGQIFQMMQSSRARFKYSLRFVKQHENTLRSD